MNDSEKSMIMIAEDDPDDRFLIRHAFEEIMPDLEIVFVDDGEALLTLLGRTFQDRAVKLPDLIVLDLNMPKVSGHQVLMEIRKKDEFNAIDIIVLSTSGEAADIDFCKDHGVHSFFIKPDSFENLLQITRSIIFHLTDTKDHSRGLEI